MTRRIFVLSGVMAVTVALAGLSAQQTPVFRTGTRIVPLYVTVVDNQGRLVPDLTRRISGLRQRKPRRFRCSTTNRARSVPW
jgi:hypothetical protein